MNILFKPISSLTVKLRRYRRARRRRHSPPVTDIIYDYTEVVRISPLYQPENYLCVQDGNIKVPSNQGLDHNEQCKLLCLPTS